MQWDHWAVVNREHPPILTIDEFSSFTHWLIGRSTRERAQSLQLRSHGTSPLAFVLHNMAKPERSSWQREGRTPHIPVYPLGVCVAYRSSPSREQLGIYTRSCTAKAPLESPWRKSERLMSGDPRQRISWQDALTCQQTRRKSCKRCACRKKVGGGYQVLSPWDISVRGVTVRLLRSYAYPRHKF